jgi:hypothetical protein
VASLEDELARRVRQLQAMEAECQEKARQCRKYEQLYHALRSRRSPPGGAAGAMSGVVVLGANGGGGPSSSSASQLGGPSASAPPSPMVMAPGPSRGAASRGGGGGSVPPALTMEGGMPARAASHDPAFAASASRKFCCGYQGAFLSVRAHAAARAQDSPCSPRVRACRKLLRPATARQWLARRAR